MTADQRLYEALRALDDATPGGLAMAYPASVMAVVQGAIDAWEYALGERNIRFKRTDVARYVDSRCTEPAPGQVA